MPRKPESMPPIQSQVSELRNLIEDWMEDKGVRYEFFCIAAAEIITACAEDLIEDLVERGIGDEKFRFV
ncbi:MAG: hypothetical protein LBS92_06475 [Candidatus Methanoplasma sp.]|nr:hypothetical protein [Candidatus Methanoplasma sp.]